MNEVDVWLEDQSLGGSALVGRLTRATSRTGEAVRFEYDAGWVASAAPVAPFSLDPDLPLSSGAHHARSGAATLTAQDAPDLSVPSPEQGCRRECLHDSTPIGTSGWGVPARYAAARAWHVFQPARCSTWTAFTC
jgi:hypothetical protein